MEECGEKQIIHACVIVLRLLVEWTYKYTAEQFGWYLTYMEKKKGFAENQLGSTVKNPQTSSWEPLDLMNNMATAHSSEVFLMIQSPARNI